MCVCLCVLCAGDSVQANILEYTEDGKIALTQWSDWEVEQSAANLEDEEETDLTIEVSRVFAVTCVTSAVQRW